jgi:hypothetical protein
MEKNSMTCDMGHWQRRRQDVTSGSSSFPLSPSPILTRVQPAAKRSLTLQGHRAATPVL